MIQWEEKCYDSRKRKQTRKAGKGRTEHGFGAALKVLDSPKAVKDH